MFQGTRGQSWMTKLFFISLWDTKMKNMALCYGIQKKKKVVKSRDVFHEHEMFNNAEKRSTTENVTEVIFIPSLDNDRNRGNVEETETCDDIGGVEQWEQTLASLELQDVDPQPRRFVREHAASKMYPNSQYILITDDGQPENFQEIQSHRDKDYLTTAMQE